MRGGLPGEGGEGRGLECVFGEFGGGLTIFSAPKFPPSFNLK